MTLENKILLILTGKDDDEAQEAAFYEARKKGVRLVILQILSSELYHYGRHDVIATWPTKRDFLIHIKEEVSKKGKLIREALKRKAEDMNVPVEIFTIETEDPVSAVLSEIKEGDYKMIFMKKEKRVVFPIFKRTLLEKLAKVTKIPIKHGFDERNCK